MAYDNQQTYAKFNVNNGCSCEDKSSCGCHEEKCGCCPVGLVEVKDKDGLLVSCLSPNDAQEYMKSTFRCPDGYVRTLDVDGNFLGCLTVEEYTAYIATLP